ncbi:MAG: hypothetical protein ACE366_18915 [Bradymonadia bacterium]
MMSRLWLCVSCMLILTTGARAFSLDSGLTTSCHERITTTSMLTLLSAFEGQPLPVQVPEDDTWRKLTRPFFTEQLLNEFPALREETFQFVLFSIIVGVRAPDTEGHSVLDLNALRRVHGDPDPRGQYAHALRGPADDHEMGNLNAVEGTREAIIELLREALETEAGLTGELIFEAQISLDFYGAIKVEVWRPAYLLGRALHALQDSFAHTLRSDDLTRIVHVMNYVDAIGGHLKEERDGMAHSDSIDDCENGVEPIVDAAEMATADMARAFGLAAQAQDPVIARALIGEVLDAWLTYEPGCTLANDYCDSVWLDKAREEQTGPYLEAIFGCSTRPGQPGGVLLGLVVLLGLMRRRALGVVALLLCVAPQSAHALWPPDGGFVSLEGHGSALSDAPDRAIISPTVGWGLRGGARWDKWGAFVHVERNHWLQLERSGKFVPGSLNTGLGVELISGGGFIRSSFTIGMSILMYDTLLDDKGTVGGFTDMRPMGLRWELAEGVRLAFDPLSFAVVAPVPLGEAPLRLFEYRTLLGVEWAP